MTPQVTWSGSKTDTEYKLALRLLSEEKEVLGDEPHEITFENFVDGLKYLKDFRFDSVEEFVNWKAKDYLKETDTGTQGYKALEFAVAVRLDDGNVKNATVFLFDKDGQYGDHRELAMLAAEAFPQGSDTYQQAWEGQYFAQVVISKFKDQAYVKYLHTDSYPVRVHVQNELDEQAPISPKWGEILKMRLKNL
ncbi:MAG: hypothetical protein A2622_02015 [Bdellovibrionales bacterium RIFCSPHIGHO2_01_FULL_40_29]|nr:MAG: hypothetical protein A2622_02015 [Bdellovibrionales bacterium RIFCSPHIGHO2_01_FULL_40_29]OFZ33865.1 MAG: hypothetical protein A3D17_02435 [Bdellovibrionales bacterium RIFCSPHIGHO2_02_FULL_40_15]